MRTSGERLIVWAGMLLGAILAHGGTNNMSRAAEYWTYVGTYTGNASRGIYVAKFNSETGKLGEVELAAEARNPSFLAIHPSGRYLYCVGEISDHQNQPTGSVSAFRIDHATGQLALLNSVPSAGAGPCHLVVDQAGKAVLVANYGGGSVSSIAIQDGGRLGSLLSSHQHHGSSVNPQRQREPHAHSINLDAANRFAFVADLGMDRIVIYRYDAASGRLLAEQAPPAAELPAGSGPRHFAFHPSGDFAYVINELRSTIEAFRYDSASGMLHSLQNISTLPEGYDESSFTAEVVVHPSGKFVYGSNRGHDSIAVFQVQQETGKLTRVQVEPTQGKTPRNFVVDPTGQFLLAENQGSNTIVIFRIDATTGRLSAMGQSVSAPVPVCIRFLKHR